MKVFAAGELKHGTIALIEEGTPVLALLSDPVLANHTRGNIQEVAARGAKVLTIAEEKCCQRYRRYRPYDCTPLPLTNLNGCTNTIGSLTLQLYTVVSMWTNHVTLLSQ